jgi:amino acid transporter
MEEEMQSNDTVKTGTLRGNLGALSIALMVIATAAPLTVMAGVSPLIIGLGNGAAAPVNALLVGLIMLLFAVGFVEMSKHISNAGAFYAYIVKGMGGVVGVGAAALAVFSYSIILIALEAYLGFVISDAAKNFLGLTIPWWVASLAVVAIVGFLGYRNIDVSTKVLGVALLLEIAIILWLNLAIFGSVGPAGMDTTGFQPSTFASGSPGLGILFTIFGFIGFESTVVYREEARDPERTIPRATYIAVIFITLLYFISFWAVVSSIGADKVVEVATGTTATMYLDLVTKHLGSAFHNAAQLLLITSIFAVCLSIHNIVARYKYILGSTGVISDKLGQVHDTHASPHVASITQTAVSAIALIAALLLGMDPVAQVYTWGAAAGTLGYMIIVVLACLSVIMFFQRNPSNAGIWKTLIAPALGGIGLLAFLFIAFSNLSALTGSEGLNAVNASILGLLVISFVVGTLGASMMRSNSPQKFEAMLQKL